MQSVGTSIVSSGVRELSKFTWFRSLISWKRAHSSCFGDGSSWSQSKPCCRKCCIPSLARTKKGCCKSNWIKDSSNLAQYCSFGLSNIFGWVTLKRSTSLAWFQTVLSIFSCAVPCNNFILRISCSVISFCRDRFEIHPLPWNPPFIIKLYPAQSSVTWLAARSKLNHKCRQCGYCPSIPEQLQDTNFLLVRRFVVLSES